MDSEKKEDNNDEMPERINGLEKRKHKVGTDTYDIKMEIKKK